MSSDSWWTPPLFRLYVVFGVFWSPCPWPCLHMEFDLGDGWLRPLSHSREWFTGSKHDALFIKSFRKAALPCPLVITLECALSLFGCHAYPFYYSDEVCEFCERILWKSLRSHSDLRTKFQYGMAACGCNAHPPWRLGFLSIFLSFSFINCKWTFHIFPFLLFFSVCTFCYYVKYAAEDHLELL